MTRNLIYSKILKVKQMNKVFKIQTRVYYEDTDAEGIVYYANYLKFAERARTEFLRFNGLKPETQKDGERCGFVAKKVLIDYQKSAFLDDLLDVTCEIKAINNSSVLIYQEIKRDETVLASMEITLVLINISKHRPTRIPDDMRLKLGSL